VGTKDYDPDVEEIHLFRERDKLAYVLILVGGIALVVALL